MTEVLYRGDEPDWLDEIHRYYEHLYIYHHPSDVGKIAEPMRSDTARYTVVATSNVSPGTIYASGRPLER